MGRGRNWLPSEADLVAEYFRAGLGDAEIGKKLNRSKTAVTLQRHKMGLAHKGRIRWTARERARATTLYRQGIRVADIANELGRTPCAVTSWLKKNAEGGINRAPPPIPYDVDDCLLALGLFRAGLGYIEIARSVDINYYTVKNYILCGIRAEENQKESNNGNL